MTTVNGLSLPQIILELIKTGRWKMPTSSALLGRVFEDFGAPCDIGAKLYLPAQMQSETSNWLAHAKECSILRGTPDQKDFPGDIDTSTTVLIGDVGIGWDAPFALDYRSSRSNPSVIHYRWSNDGDLEHNRWIQISRTIESFVGILEL